ncbi:hypothetical protein [Hyphomicrobium sp.]|uniref:hypothetical protein n=1 Tax=Hyphomicrobium sp. TaxID=82 RepID=UPI001D462FC9|nr:hypothetical protein [Hyphomicrobium sp.]MBY0561531.1 hypothetical protein [Hyphomicrobium sp.]
MNQNVRSLVDAMAQLLDDMGEDGLCVCALAKAHARVALQPFLDDDGAGLMPLDKANQIIANCEF